jgi:hypothetical protein
MNGQATLVILGVIVIILIGVLAGKADERP